MSATHEEVIDALGRQLAPVLENSPDGVYLWLDEVHKTCNEHLARMFGWSVEEWRATSSFLDTFVAEEDRAEFSWNYRNSVAALSNPVMFRFRALRKDGSTFEAETVMIPLSYEGHAIAYHFVREVVA